MPEFVMIHDLRPKDDPLGRTYKEINLAMPHNIPVGTLVELAPSEGFDKYAGVRLYVVHHHRDCDGTPLYAMAADRYDTEMHDPRFHNPKWVHGHSEDSLRIVDPQPPPPQGD